MSLQILHTNDQHGTIVPIVDKVLTGEPKHFSGAATMATLIEQARRTDPEGTLLFDAGDAVSGQIITDLDQGRSMVEIMNRYGYAAGTIGNHDFDFKMPALEDRMTLAKFPMVVTNVRYQNGESLPNSVTSMVLEREGVKVGVVGLLTDEMDELVLPQFYEGLTFEDPEDALERELPKLKAAGAEMVIALTHCGLEDDIELAEEFPGQGMLIIGGHSHDSLDGPMEVAGNWVAQAGSHGRQLGRIQVDFDTAKRAIKKVTGELLVVDPEKTPPDSEVAALVEHYKAEAEKVLGEVVGTSPEPLTRCYHQDSTLGNWVTDAMREAVDADLAFINSAGLRADLPQGEVTAGNVLEVRPFDGMVIWKGELQGRHILAALEKSLEEYCIDSEEHTNFLQASGLTMTFDASAEPGQRLLSVEIDGQPLDPDEEYTVALEEYLARGNVGYEMFKEGDYQELGLPTREVLRKAAANIDVTPAGSRLKDLTPKS